jgi:hypothetical protein
MIHRKGTSTGVLLAALAFAAVPSPAHAAIFGKKKPTVAAARKLTPAQSALVDKAILREKAVIKVVRERTPLVETYIQMMRPDPVMLQVPDSDQHFLGRVDFNKVIGDQNYAPAAKKDEHAGKMGFLKKGVGFLGGLTESLHLDFNESGFVQMILMDSQNFDRQHYEFTFVRNAFLGNVPTALFNVAWNGPHNLLTGSGNRGRFFGSIYVDTRNGNVVRFNGEFGGSEKDQHEYYHFDSWRTNIQDNLWLPTAFYVEESDPKSATNTLKFKAINYVWGYVLKVPPRDAENTEMTVEGANDVSNDAQDISPLGAQREWVQQAEDNIIDRFFQAGLIDAPSEFDKTLEALATNILAYNNIATSRPLRVRTLLTEPLESLAVGNTILISKGLLDTTAVPTQDGAQQMGNLNALLAFQIAHIVSGHRLDTKYAFNDRLLFPDNAAFERIPMHHTDADNAEAAKKTMELLSAKELEGGQQYFGLYLQQLQVRLKALKALNEPMVGDSLIKSDADPTFWLQSMVAKAPKLDVKNLKQQAAMPLASFLRFDPWTDQVIQMHSAFEPLLNASDKMPFEVTPVYIKLSYYKAPAPPAPVPVPALAPAGATGAEPAPANEPAPAATAAPGTAAAPTPR